MTLSKTKLTIIIAVILLLLVITTVLILCLVTGVDSKDLNHGGTEEVIEKKPWFSVRLPRYLIPIHYEVDLKPDLTPDFSGLYWFNGSSSVSFTVLKTTSTIVIHSSKLNYTSINLTSVTGAECQIKDIKFFEPNDYLIVELEAPLRAHSNYTLETQFFGELKNDMTGLYRSDYTKASGAVKTIAASHMQASYARETFPCFDEPGLKATFDISLWHDPSNFALSNMDKMSMEEKPDGWRRTKFNRTPRMSTYLLAFVVCDFDYVTGTTNTTPVIETRILARSEQIDAGNAEYASAISLKILEYYTEFFGVAYPLPKADQIALPDFDIFSAMENWGLIMYRENRLLYDDSTNSVFVKQEIARVIAHELTHQWFGNIISPLWWDEIWLNEGFATYVQYLGVDRVEPTWQMNDQFIVGAFHRAMSVDGLVTSRPIVAQNVSTKEEIDALFDDISYAKGACIIRMIRSFAGDDAFQLGLMNYLNANKYGSVTHQQLFKYWEEAINQRWPKRAEEGSNPPTGFISAMNTWVLQMGFPTVSVKRHPSKSNTVVLSQKRFLLDLSADPTEPKSQFEYSWVIPFWYADQSSLTRKLVWIVPGSESEIQVSENEYIVGNYEVLGYYRVNYEEKMWGKIISQLNQNFQIIDPKNRGQLLDDAFNLARAGQLSYEIALNLSKTLRRDFSYISWKSAFDGFSYIGKMLARSNTSGYYSNYLLNLVTSAYERFGWNIEEGHLQIFLQSLVIDAACSLGNKICLKSATGQFHQWKAAHSSQKRRVIPNFRPVVYCQSVAHGEEEDWNFVWEKYKVEEDSQEKSILLAALTCTYNKLLVERLLDFTKNGSYIRNQDGPTVLTKLCNNGNARDTVWNFIKNEWGFVYSAYGPALFSFRNIIQTCTSSFSTPSDLQELETFVQNNTDRLGYGWKPFEQAVEQVKVNILWRSKNEKFLHNWFQSAIFT